MVAIRNDQTGEIQDLYNYYLEHGEIRGTGGKVRHAGQFSPNNPYYVQLQYASNNKDRDALYAKAVQWEADIANQAIKDEHDRAILEEQRWYDSPEQQILRQRQAGINPDLASGSGSGSGVGSGSSATMPYASDFNTDQSVKFSNAYDNTAEVLNGINTAATVLQTFASFGSSVVSAYDTLSTNPARVSLADTQAEVAEKTKDAAIMQANETARGTKLANAGKILETAKQTLNLYGTMAGQFTEGATDEEITNAFAAQGIPQESLQQHVDGFKQYLKNPQAQAAYQQSVKDNNALSSYNSSFTPEVLGSINKLTAQQQIQGKIFAINRDNFANSIIKYKKAYGLDKLEAQSQFGEIQTTLEEQELIRLQLKDAIKGVQSSVVFNENAISKLEEERQSIIDRANSDGRQLNDVEKAKIKDIDIRKSYIETATVNQKTEVLSMLLDTQAGVDFMQMNTNDKGNIKNGTVEREQQNNMYFTVLQLSNASWKDINMTDRVLDVIDRTNKALTGTAETATDAAKLAITKGKK